MPPTFASRYLSHELSDFFNLAPGATAAALELPRPIDRGPLCAALTRQAERLGAPRAVHDSLEKLAQPQSRVVVTGQQVGVLLGPLYTLSKAVSAVALAERLSTEERPVLPVFWLASQDADSAEIDHTYLLGMDERLHKLALPLPAGVPAGRIPLEQAHLERVLTALADVAGPTTYRDEVTELLRSCAERASSVADWFGAILYRLLGHTGLIVLDPLKPGVAALFRPVLEAELAAPLRSGEAINAAAASLRARGLSAQLGRAAGATNLFVEESGQRRLLRFDGTRFETETATYSREALSAMLSADPTCLTPAAGLRPITQDAALPTAATVVGPGELRYFAQLRGVYEQHGVAMPLIWPRTTATILEPPASRILSKFGLRASDLQGDFTATRDQKLLELHGFKLAFDNRLRALRNLSASMKADVLQIDPTLERTVARAGAELENIFGKLEGKSAAALADRDDVYTRQFERLRLHLMPEGTPQERLISPFSFFLKFGIQNVVNAFLALPAEGDHEVRF